ncbi:MAG: TolC family protein [Paludibacter sp.]|nr:TolC family protein [Paludibacter sp.]
MIKSILTTILLLFNLLVLPQHITLDLCLEKTRENYPLIKQYGLIEKTLEYNLSNAGKAYLPQLSLNARATYQSDVVSLPASIPIPIPELSKDQYAATIDVNQVLWDGGVTSAQKVNIKASAAAEKQKLEIDLFSLNERVVNLFFGILLLNEQISQTAMLHDELQRNLLKVESLVQNGIASKSDHDLIQVELLQLKQQELDLSAKRKSYFAMLSAFTKLSITENSIFEKPLLPLFSNQEENKRPEMYFFNAQSDVLNSQRSLIQTANLPKLGLFVQGGYGKPGLNMLSNEFSTLYIGGVRLSWNISGYYAQKNNLEKINLGIKQIETSKETFLFNTSLLTEQQKNEIERLKNVMQNDQEIIRLRSSIVGSSKAKVENGTLTVTELLRDINAENTAKQTSIMHEIQLLMTAYQYKLTLNQ